MSVLLLVCWVISFYVSSDRAIPSSNIDLHYAHCSRNLERCKICGDMVPKKYSDEHFLSTHAPVCDFIRESSLTFPWMCWQVLLKKKMIVLAGVLLCSVFMKDLSYFSKRGVKAFFNPSSTIFLLKEKNKTELCLAMIVIYCWWCNPVGVLLLYRSVSYLIDHIFV